MFKLLLKNDITPILILSIKDNREFIIPHIAYPLAEAWRIKMRKENQNMKKKLFLASLLIIFLFNTISMAKGENLPISVDVSKNPISIHVCVHYVNDDSPLWRASVVLYSEPSGRILKTASELIVPDAITYTVYRTSIPETDTVFFAKFTNVDDKISIIYNVSLVDDVKNENNQINIENIENIEIYALGALFLISSAVLVTYLKKK